MEGKTITVDKLVEKGFEKGDSFGMSNIYSKPYSWGEKVILYNRDTMKVLVSTRLTNIELERREAISGYLGGLKE